MKHAPQYAIAALIGIGFLLGTVFQLGFLVYKEWRQSIQVEAEISRENYLLERYHLTSKEE